MKDRNLTHSDEWSTPKSFYDELNKEFNFDFDPCPLSKGKLITPETDGLLIEWGGGKFHKPTIQSKVKRSVC